MLGQAARIGVLGLALGAVGLGLGATKSVAQCAGDCDSDGRVSAGEVVAGIGIALGRQRLDRCSAADLNLDRRVGIDEIVRAVDATVFGCGTARLLVRGVCREPGQAGFGPCAGRSVDVRRCDDRETCLSEPEATTDVGGTTVGEDGSFRAVVNGAAAGRSPLIVEAMLGATPYRVLAFGPAGPGGNGGGSGEEATRIEVVIDPSSEAAVFLVDEAGLEGFDDANVLAVIDAVAEANRGTTFPPSAAAAVAVAIDNARDDPGVAIALDEQVGCGTRLLRRIDPVGDSDPFTFVGGAGEDVAVVVSKLDGDAAFGPCWAAVDPNGSRLNLSNRSGNVVCGSAVFPLRLPGPYTIVVEDEGNDGRGAYELRIEPRSATFGGESKSTCAAPIGCGKTVFGTLSANLAGDTYQFRGLPDEWFHVATFATGGEPGFVPCWALYDPDGAQRDLSNRRGNIVCRRTPFKLNKEGPHTIVVVDDDGDAKGSYGLQLQPQSATVDRGESCAPEIRCGETFTDRFLEADVAVGVFRFAGAARERFTVTVTRQDGEFAFDPCWNLRNPAGVVFDLSNMEDNAICGEGTFSLGALGGDHTITVFDRLRDGKGSYSIALRCDS
jgi:hypothetical protein